MEWRARERRKIIMQVLQSANCLTCNNIWEDNIELIKKQKQQHSSTINRFIYKVDRDSGCATSGDTCTQHR